MNIGSLITFGQSIHAELEAHITLLFHLAFAMARSVTIYTGYTKISCTGGGTIPRHLHMLGTTQLESRLAEKDLGVLVETKLNVCPGCKEGDGNVGCIRKSAASRSGEAILLYSALMRFPLECCVQFHTPQHKKMWMCWCEYSKRLQRSLRDWNIFLMKK